jgi:hypothetical protein
MPLGEWSGENGNGGDRGCAWCYSADLHVKLGAEADLDRMNAPSSRISFTPKPTRPLKRF